MATLTHAIAQSLSRGGSLPAIFFHEQALSFAELDAWSERIAAGLLRCGISPGDRVAVGLPNSPELVAAVLATLRSGAILVPLNSAATGDELAYLLRDCGAALLITSAEQARAARAGGVSVPILTGLEPLTAAPARALPSRAAADPALIIYTSGTTDRPKGAVLSQGALFTNFRAVADLWQWTRSDRLLLTLPCFHLHGLGLGVLTSLLVGSSIVLRSRFVAEEALALLSRYECTMFFGVPTMYHRLISLPDEALAAAPLFRMRMWVSGSAPMPASTYERFRQRFGYALMNRYGMTEAGCVLSTHGDETRRAGIVGRPLPGVELRLVDPDRLQAGEMIDTPDGEPGELLFRGPSLFSGYWNRPQETQRAFLSGFLRSGDLAIREADGAFRIMGRRSVDIIKSRGFKISAVEIESCLQAHPAVAEAAVVGIPDADRGEAVVAVIKLATAATASAEQLRAHAREHLSAHKVPAQIVFMDDIPQIGPGKFKKRELIERLRPQPDIG